MIIYNVTGSVFVLLS